METLVSKLAEAENQLETGYAQLAFVLADVSKNRYWEGSYESFGDFMNHLHTKFNLGKRQLYNYLSVARELGTDVSQQQLNDMGISKALVLRDAKKASGTVPELSVKAAQDPQVTVKDLKQLLYDSKALPKPQDGDWLDLDFSCYVTPEERETFNDAANAARHSDPSISETLSESAARKEILMRWAMSFLSDHGADTVPGGRGL